MSEKNEFVKKTSYRKKRYFVYAIVSIISLVMPFIQINGNQLFLLSFDKKQFHLMGTAFDMQELYLMPFLLMLLFIGIFTIIYRYLIESTLLKLRRIKNKQKDIDLSKNGNKIKKFIGVILWSILSLVAASNFMWYFVPPQDFFAYIQDPLEHMFLIGIVLSIAAFLIYDVIILKEDFCVYICPYSRVQSVLYDNNTYQAIYSTKRGGKIYDENKEKVVWKIKDLPDPANECTACEACVTVCPTHIDIRKGLQLECINCLECVDACTTVMGKLGKPSLVQWSSTNTIVENKPTKLLRKTTIMYFISLTITFALLFAMSGEKEYMLLNVNKDTELYKIKEDNIEIVDNPGIEIKRFTPFTLSPKKMAKKVLILETDKLLVDDKTKDTPISITIKAYAQ